MWISIDSPDAIDKLMHEFHDFDDACLREAVLTTGSFVHQDRSMTLPGELDASLRLVFQSQSSELNAIELRCDRLLGFTFIATPDGHDSIIVGATISIVEGSFRLALKFSAGPLKGPPNSFVWVPAGSEPDVIAVSQGLWLGVHCLGTSAISYCTVRAELRMAPNKRLQQTPQTLVVCCRVASPRQHLLICGAAEARIR